MLVPPPLRRSPTGPETQRVRSDRWREPSPDARIGPVQGGRRTGLRARSGPQDKALDPSIRSPRIKAVFAMHAACRRQKEAGATMNGLQQDNKENLRYFTNFLQSALNSVESTGNPFVCIICPLKQKTNRRLGSCGAGCFHVFPRRWSGQGCQPRPMQFRPITERHSPVELEPMGLCSNVRQADSSPRIIRN